MRTLIYLVILFITSLCYCQDVHVNGYYRSNGTYVQPHYRSHQDWTPNNNWTVIGNRNPYTGEYGTLPKNYSYPSRVPNVTVYPSYEKSQYDSSAELMRLANQGKLLQSSSAVNIPREYKTARKPAIIVRNNYTKIRLGT